MVANMCGEFKEYTNPCKKRNRVGFADNFGPHEAMIDSFNTEWADAAVVWAGWRALPLVRC